MLWISDEWKDYEVLDTSNGERLERWGNYVLVRPDPQVIWNTPRRAPQWRQFDAATCAPIPAADAGRSIRSRSAGRSGTKII